MFQAPAPWKRCMIMDLGGRCPHGPASDLHRVPIRSWMSEGPVTVSPC